MSISVGKADTSQLDGNPFENGASLKKKPWLTPQEQVEHLRNQGVRFDLMSENDATSYLAKNNNFFRLRSYRQGFAKVEEGKRKGQFANLDFKMLVDLSIIDMLFNFLKSHAPRSHRRAPRRRIPARSRFRGKLRPFEGRQNS